MIINGIKRNVRSMLKRDETYVNLREFATALNLDVSYDAKTKDIKVSEKKISQTPQPYKKENIFGATVITVDPRNIFAVETQKATNRTPYKNFVNGVYFMYEARPEGKYAYPQGMVVNAGEVMQSYMTHGKPNATIIVHSWNDVEMKYISDIENEKDVWFAYSGFGIYPKITAAEEGFTGKFSDVLRACSRPILGYRKKDNKMVIAVGENLSVQNAHDLAADLCLDFAISLDGGGSTTLKIGGEYIFAGDGRKLYGGIIFS